MSKLRIGLDIQHIGRLSRPGDQGAVADTDKDGKPDAVEALLTPRYMLGIMEGLDRERFEVFVFGAGEYHSSSHKQAPYTRQGLANHLDLDVYLALHLNASKDPGAGYGLFLWDHRTKPGNGDALARSIAGHWKSTAAKLLGSNMSVRARAASRDQWSNAYYTIRGLNAPIGICCEPFFLSNPAHLLKLGTPDGLHQCGLSIAQGITAWAESRQERQS